MNTVKFRRKKGSCCAPMSGVCGVLRGLEYKINDAAGAVTLLEMRLRIVAELLQEVQDELRELTQKKYYEADLYYLIPAVLKMFRLHLTDIECEQIEACRPPRNKLSHASFVEFMLKVNGSAPGLKLNPQNGKPYELKKENLLEGCLSVNSSRALENFTCAVKTAIRIVEDKIMEAIE